MNREEYIKGLCEKVISKYPEIKKEEIIVRGLEHVSDYLIQNFGLNKTSLAIAFIPSFSFFGLGPKIKKTKMMLIIGKKFLENFSPEEQEAAIAHEMGHYRHYKQKVTTLKRLERSIKWGKEEVSKNFLDLKERLQRWYLLNEIYADNQAVIAGYGRSLLLVLSKDEDTGHPSMAPRIKNLEKMLGLEK